ISAHCARGIAQFPTYEYMGAFSFASDDWANDDEALHVVIATAHTANIIRPDTLFMESPSRRAGFGSRYPGDQVYTKCGKGSGLAILRELPTQAKNALEWATSRLIRIPYSRSPPYFCNHFSSSRT